MVGVTRMKKLFERAADDFEYRIDTADGIRICSASNLVLRPTPPKMRVVRPSRMNGTKLSKKPRRHTYGWSGKGDRSTSGIPPC